eukprot:m.41033 g.41033  ORF g.41033 m.41033 type:complete len:455 (-) comp10430_c0_seq1:27-1391(-)
MAAQEAKAGAAMAAASASAGPCSICLASFRDRSHLTTCFHAFCFRCITTWASVTCACPLCKRPFHTIIHKIVSETVFETYSVKRPTAAVKKKPAREREPHRPFDVSKRRAVYASGARALPEYEESLQHRERRLSAAALRADPRNALRIHAWLSRELVVLVGDHAAVDFVRTLVLSLIERLGVQTSEEMQSQLRPFLFEQTDHFLHELALFARSRLDIAAYDRHVKYDNPDAIARATYRKRHRAPQQPGAYTPPDLPPLPTEAAETTELFARAARAALHRRGAASPLSHRDGGRVTMPANRASPPPLTVLPQRMAAPASPSARAADALRLSPVPGEGDQDKDGDGNKGDQIEGSSSKRVRHDTPSPPPPHSTDAAGQDPDVPTFGPVLMSLDEQLRVVEAELARERKLLLRLHMLREQRAAARRTRAEQAAARAHAHLTRRARGSGDSDGDRERI